MLFMCGPIRHYWFLVAVGVIKEFKLHVYGKRQTAERQIQVEYFSK